METGRLIWQLFTRCEHFLSPKLAPAPRVPYAEGVDAITPEIAERVAFAALIMLAVWMSKEPAPDLRATIGRLERVQRWLTEDRERYEGIRSPLGRAEVELAEAIAEIVKALG